MPIAIPQTSAENCLLLLYFGPINDDDDDDDDVFLIRRLYMTRRSAPRLAGLRPAGHRLAAAAGWLTGQFLNNLDTGMVDW